MSYESPHLQLQSDRFEAYGLKAPTVPANITFVLGYHGSAEDFPLTLRDDHERADLALHEMVAWTPDYQDTLNDIAKGTYVSSASELPINQRKIELIKNTSASQAVWDIPAANIAAPRYFRYHFQGEFANDLARLDASRDAGYDVMEKYFLMMEGRDKYGAKAITRSINKYVCKDEEPVNVLVIAGLSHVAMANAYQALSEQSEHLSVKISATHEQICIDALSSYVMARHVKGDLDSSDVDELADRLIQERQLNTGSESRHDVLARHYQY